METNFYNLFAIAIGIISLIVSVVAIIASLTSSLIANLNSSAANDIAKKALEISTFRFQYDVLPQISIKFYPVVFNNEVKCVIFIKNKSIGKAVIEKIEGHFVEVLTEELKRFPLEILFNGSELVYVEVPAIDHQHVSDQARELNLSIQDVYKTSFNAIAKGGHFEVFFSDMLGKRYSIFLEYKVAENEFVGTPQELKKA